MVMRDLRQLKMYEEIEGRLEPPTSEVKPGDAEAEASVNPRPTEKPDLESKALHKSENAKGASETGEGKRREEKEKKEPDDAGHAKGSKDPISAASSNAQVIPVVEHVPIDWDTATVKKTSGDNHPKARHPSG